MYLIVAPNKEKVTPKLSKKYPLKSRKVPPNIDPQIKRNLPPPPFHSNKSNQLARKKFLGEISSYMGISF